MPWSIHNDGIFGSQTQEAVNSISNLGDIISVFTARRQVVYRETSGFNLFGTDWIRRAIQIGNEALSMEQRTKIFGMPIGLGTRTRPIRTRYYLEGKIK